MTFLDDKRIASSLEKRTIICKAYFGSRIFYLSGNDPLRKIQLYPNRWAWTKIKLMTSLLFFFFFFFFFFDDVTLSGWTCSFQKYIILTRSYVCFFSFKNSSFIVSNYRKSLIFHGYDVDKCERLCIGVSAFNLAKEFWWMNYGGVTRVGS